MTVSYIEYGDTGKVAREKINSIMHEVEASIPSIWENWHWYIWWVDTGITAVGLELRPTNNLIQQNANHETYTDLQFRDGLSPVSSFPIGITVGNVSSDDGWAVSGILINSRTPNHYTRLLYGSDGVLYFDSWTWVFKSVATTADLTNQLEALRESLATVAFTGLSSDLDNDMGFNSVPVLTEDEWEVLPWTAWDDKRYMIYEEVEE